MGQAAEPEKVTEEFIFLGLNAVGTRQPWKVLGQRDGHWTLKKQALSLMGTLQGAL